MTPSPVVLSPTTVGFAMGSGIRFLMCLLVLLGYSIDYLQAPQNISLGLGNDHIIVLL